MFQVDSKEGSKVGSKAGIEACSKLGSRVGSKAPSILPINAVFRIRTKKLFFGSNNLNSENLSGQP